MFLVVWRRGVLGRVWRYGVSEIVVEEHPLCGVAARILHHLLAGLSSSQVSLPRQRLWPRTRLVRAPAT